MPHKITDQRASVAAVGFGFGSDDYCCRDAVAGFHLQEADALGVAAGFADGVGVHADDFAVVADQHDFGGFVDLGDGDDFADTFGGLHVDHAFATAVGEAIFVGGSTLAESVFGDREDERAFHRYVDDFGFALRSPHSRPLPHLLRGCRPASGLIVVAMPTT